MAGQARPRRRKRCAFAVLPVLLLDEGREGCEILRENLLQGFLDALALLVEGVADRVQIGLRLAHDRTGNTWQRVLQVICRADAAERTPRVRDDRDRLDNE